MQKGLLINLMFLHESQLFLSCIISKRKKYTIFSALMYMLLFLQELLLSPKAHYINR